MAQDIPGKRFSILVQTSWTFTNICEHLQLMYPKPSLMHSHVLQSIMHLDTFLPQRLYQKELQKQSKHVFEQQHKESATLAFPGGETRKAVITWYTHAVGCKILD